MQSETSADDAIMTLSEARIESVQQNSSRRPPDDSRADQSNVYDDVVDDPDNSAESSNIRSVVGDLVASTLLTEDYEPCKCKKLCEQLAREALERINRFQIGSDSRRKYVVVVSIGSVASQPSSSVDNGGAVYFGSKCLWNGLTDHFTSVKFNNSSLYAIASVFTVRWDDPSQSDTIQCSRANDE